MKENNDINSHELISRILEQKDLQDMLTLQQVAIAHLDSKDVLQPTTVQEFETILSGNGFIIGLFDDQKLIAYRTTLVPPLDEEHLGLDAGLSKETLERVIYQDLSIVHPDYRGQGLQKQMGELVMARINRTLYDYVCATVAPYNIPSLKDKFALGLQVFALKEKYQSKLRYVFMKKLNETLQIDTTEEGRLIPMDDTHTQQQTLNEGYVGVGMHYNNGWFVQYHKLQVTV
ncbi:hypothetical protein [Paenisporosarcina sp. TG20]|uniref:hypothetical protein n=1 Tax=Paenisporosarcina sp. TG20 TaxID=1211706 RepID=UPI0002F9DCDA|nr:hypothetical protein [Paenisporosarcina sp. TG20]